MRRHQRICIHARRTPPWNKKILLSINRFEKKKNVGLAIEAFAGLSAKERNSVRLVIAGGYDTRVAENVATHKRAV